MPFTFSHPAIILPLLKAKSNRFSGTALVIGSMAPDFEYFIRMELLQQHGHTLAGIFYFDLPLVILLTFIYHLIVRDPLIEHLPNFIRHRFMPYFKLDWLSWVKKHWFVLIYSSILGILAHLFWDAFTHQNGIFVKHIPVLQGQINVLGVDMMITEFGQIMSTLIGAVIILLYLMIIPKSSPSRFEFAVIKYWFLVMMVAFATLLVRYPHSLSTFIATSISGFFIGIIAVSASRQLYLKRIQTNTRHHEENVRDV